MDEIREKPSIVRYIYCVVAVIMLLCGLTYLLSSCTEIVDGPAGKKGKGVKVPVIFSVHIGTHDSEVTVEPRKTKATNEPITDFAHVRGDVFLYATFEEEHPVTTRAMTTNLSDGSLVRIVAYNLGGTVIESSAIYVASAGELTPLTDGLFVDDGYAYIFVAYSLNDNTIPAQDAGSPTLTFSLGSLTNPDLDLLWGKTTSPVLGASDNETVEITMNHLFARVRVQATTGAIIPAAPIKKLENVHVNPSYRGTMTLNVITGIVTPQSSTPDGTGTLLTRWREQGASTWVSGSNLNYTNVESDYFYIFTNGSTKTVLKIGNLNVNDIDLGAYEFGFTNTELIPGHSYTMKLNFKKLIWAGSNIFWDNANQKLTFLPETAPEAAQGYQGVYFMWGSLIGISPQGPFDDANTILYVPGATTWSNTQRTASGLNSWGGTSMADIPRIKTGDPLTYGALLEDYSTRNYLSDTHNPSGLTGDICKYLSDRDDVEGEWRMPNAREFGETPADYNTFNINGGWISSNVNVAGTSNFYAGDFYSFAIKTVSRTVFPGGGYRMYSGGSVSTMSTLYLSGSPSFTSTNQTQTFDAFFGMFLVAATLRPYGSIPLVEYHQGPVRCIKIEGDAIFLDLDQPTADVEDWDPGGTFGQGDTDGQGNLWY